MARRLRFLMALVAAVVIGVGGASAVMATVEPPPAEGPADLVPDGTGAVIATTGADPDAARGGTTPLWAVRVYRSQTGLTCPDVNRVVDGAFGRVDGDGTFVPLPLDASGACAELTAAHPYSLLVRHFPANDERGARAVVFGSASADVSAITMTTDGTAQDVPVEGGAFVAALDEDDADMTTVAFTLPGGTQETHALQSDPSIATTP